MLLVDEIPEVTFGLGLTGVLAIFVYIENPLDRSGKPRLVVLRCVARQSRKFVPKTVLLLVRSSNIVGTTADFDILPVV